MKFSYIVMASCLLLILGVPFLLSMGGGRGTYEDGAPTLIVFTPHVPQIRDEFARSFSDWHEREYGEKANLDFRTPGGTSEIIKQLKAMYNAALDDIIEDGNFSIDPNADFVLPAGSIAADVILGGGSYDHGKLRKGITYHHTTGDKNEITVNLQVPMSSPASFTQEELDELFGENRIGTQELYDPDQYWIGTALSSFGIVYNNDVLDKLGLATPESFEDLTAPEYWGWIALADPRQSGSVTTTFDSILGNEGWEQGWRTLRAMSGNTRYFTNSATKPPIDVSQGEAAAGLAIDFYGRGQAQVIKDSGGGDRVGYTDPRGAVYVDADPVTILNGAPNPELAMRFVRFCLSEEAQALWQFKHWDGNTEPVTNPMIPGTEEIMGPKWYDLRRMPVRRVMYEKYFDQFIDQVDPFTLASDVKNPGWRTGVEVMMGCFGIDIAKDCRNAYKALNEALASGDFTQAELDELDALYYAFPETRIEALKNLPGFAGLSDASKALMTEMGWQWQGQVVESLKSGANADGQGVRDLWDLAHVEHYEPFTQASFRMIRNEWKQPRRQAILEIEYAKFYRSKYRELVGKVHEKR